MRQVPTDTREQRETIESTRESNVARKEIGSSGERTRRSVPRKVTADGSDGGAIPVQNCGTRSTASPCLTRDVHDDKKETIGAHRRQVRRHEASAN